MTWLIVILFLVVLFELISAYIFITKIGKVSAALCILFIAADSILIIGLRPALWAILIAYFSAFRIFNLARLIYGKKQIKYLRSTFLRASLVLALYQLAILLIDYLLNLFGLTNQAGWSSLTFFILLGLVVVAMSLRRGLVKTRPKLKPKFVEDTKLPDVTVAIPARNETEDLEDCLSSLVASDYPRLEVLVLDDCSQEKRTPMIIRQFAHAGVRFLEGKVPSESWNAKNFAYEQLADEANGDVILFCGVDVRFDPKTIRDMVELKIMKKKTMVSFMPVNVLPVYKFKRLLLQPVRYLWELGLPRRSLNRPPVLSTCWLIDRKVLKDNGKFKAVSRSIVPERYFARQCARNDDGYSFVCLGKSIGLTSAKNFDEQLATAIRTRYPLSSQRLENVSILALTEAALFIAPIGLLIGGLISASLALIILSALCIAITSLVMYVITKLAYDTSLSLSSVAYSLIFAYDIGLSIYSMWRYEFSEVVWKGRNVCIPVMRNIDY